MERFTWTVEDDGPARVVATLCGEFDLSARMRVDERMVSLVVPGSLVVVDTHAVTFMDSSGLHVLAHMWRVARQVGAMVRLVGPGEAVLRVLELAGLAGRFEIYPDRDSALAPPDTAVPMPDGVG